MHYFPQETLQIILATDGRASFLLLLLDDGASMEALGANGVLTFSAGDTVRISNSRPGSLNSVGDLQDTLNLFRIDGECTIYESLIQ